MTPLPRPLSLRPLLAGTLALMLVVFARVPIAAAAEHAEVDILASKPAERGAEAALQRIQNDPTLRRIATVSQVETRFGVPTFLWGARPAATALKATAKLAPEQAARAQLETLAPFYRLSDADVQGAQVRYVHDTGRGGVIVAFKQSVGGVEVFRDELKVMLDRNHNLIAASGYIPSRSDAGKSGTFSFRLTAADAVGHALGDFAGDNVDRAGVQLAGRAPGGYQNFDIRTAAAQLPAALIPNVPARAKPVLFHVPGALEPGYYVELMSESQAYAYVISATDGSILFRHSLMESDVYNYRVWADNTSLHTPFDGPQGDDPTPHPTGIPDNFDPPLLPPGLQSLQNGPISTNDPWLPPGATETNGNNVDAYTDLSAPDGLSAGDFRATTTAANTFDRVYDTTQPPNVSTDQQMAAVTQLFYNDNYFHDWYYDAGFDEASGNGQASNYGRGGIEGDPVHAEAEDYSGTNNANMSTPADGGSPRMQMYVFTPSNQLLTVNSPLSIAGNYTVGAAVFGPVAFDLTADVVLVDDGVAPTSNGCETPFTSVVTGKIALIDRGVCGFAVKVKNAQTQGAIGVIIANNAAGVITMGGTDPTITIPSLMVSQSDGAAIKTALLSGTVNVRMLRVGLNRDGSLDNQIVAHEWGHYISNRLIGNASGLTNNMGSGMGEGWADFHAMLMTARAEDALVPSNANYNGVYPLAGYALSVSGAPGNTWYFGIRRVPYSTDFSKDGLTFKHIQNGVPLPPEPTAFGADGSQNAEVHNTGEVWCSMLWECYASLLRDTGRLTFDQSRTRMRDYIVAAYEMTPNSPTLTEARDALLAAAYAGDPADFNLFCESFARRGAGTGAIAPDRFSTDNVGVVESYFCGGDLAFISTTINDDVTSCDHDGYLDSNETGTVTVTLKNAGGTTLSGTTATVSSTNPNVSFPAGATISFPTSQPYQTVAGTLQIHMSGAAGQQVIDLLVSYDDPSLVVPGPRLAGTTTYGNVDLAPSTLETVEEAAPAWTFAGNPLESGNAWRKIEVTSTQHQFFAPDPGGVSDEYLVSPPLQVAASGSFTIQFSHAYSFEISDADYDGGVVEISEDNGATWSDIGAFASPGYGGTIFVGANNPLSGRPAYVGQSAGWPALQPESIDLGTTYATKTVMVRFRLGADEASSAPGWYINDVQANNITNLPFQSLVPQAGPAASSVSVGSDLSPAACGQKVNLTATVTPASATGTVQFYDSGVPLGGPVTIAAGTAMLSVTFLAVPPIHPITATYSGDACNAGSTSNEFDQRVDGGLTTVTAGADNNPAKVGTKVNLTATVVPAAATGVVSFNDEDGFLGQATIVGGVATLSLTTLAIGPHQVVVIYNGDDCYAPSTSAPYMEQIIPDNPPTVTVIAPNGGEHLLASTMTKLSWSATDDNAVVSVSLYLSRDNGATWETIATDIPNTGTYMWTVTGPGTNTDANPVFSALFKVTAKDNAGQTSDDQSDAAFSIFDATVATIVTRMDVTTSDAGIELRWAMRNHGVFTSVVVQRAASQIGPWSAAAVDVREDGDMTVALDRSAESGRKYWYRLVATTNSGAQAIFGPIEGTAAAPKAFALSAAYPNPTRGPMRMEFALPRTANVKVSLVDLQGREVVVMAAGSYAAGRYQVSWDGHTDRGDRVAAGVYFLRYHTPDKNFVTRLAITR